VSESPFAEDVYVGTWTDAALLNNLLVREGIQTIVAADKHSNRFVRAVYVIDVLQIDRAREIVARFIRNEPLDHPKSYRSWRCRTCNELIEGQFEVCWNCQGART
jgi:rubrerythrin